MAQKRMFSLQIVDTDAFLDMPTSSQLLYFHLAMRADDEGFVSSPKKIMKMVGSSDDDLKVLMAKKFVIGFESGVCVIKHWLIHNTIRMDRFGGTTYIKERSQLLIKDNKAYKLVNIDKKELETVWQPSGNQVATQYNISKDKLSKDNIREDKIIATPSVADKDMKNLISLFEPINPSYKKLFANTTQRKSLQGVVSSLGLEKTEQVLKLLPKTNSMQYAPTITTPLQLEQKLGQLIAFLQKEKLKAPKLVTIS